MIKSPKFYVEACVTLSLILVRILGRISMKNVRKMYNLLQVTTLNAMFSKSRYNQWDNSS